MNDEADDTRTSQLENLDIQLDNVFLAIYLCSMKGQKCGLSIISLIKKTIKSKSSSPAHEGVCLSLFLVLYDFDLYFINKPIFRLTLRLIMT